MTAREKIANEIRNTNGKIFTVTFKKRTTGEVRTLNGRLNVKKYLKGGSLKYSAKDNNLISVFDVKAMAYKMIAIEGIIEYKCEGVVIRINE